MKILISTRTSAFRAVAGEDRHVHFAEPPADLATPLSSNEQIDIWIANGSEITNTLLDQWLERGSRISTKVILAEDVTVLPWLRYYLKDRVAIAAFPSPGQAKVSNEESVLRQAELLYARGLHQAAARTVRPANKTSVTLVGAGINNLITADFLATRGILVIVVDAGPDPRYTKDWTQLGITSGGGNARMFTRTEADNYNEKGDAVYADMQGLFRKTARNGGWSVKDPSAFTRAENAWVDEFEQLPPWLARSFKEDILSITRDADKLWKEIQTTAPDLFEDVEYRQDIIRLYAEQKDVEGATELTQQLGTILEAPTQEQFLAENPGFRAAAAADHLAGAIKIQGFTVNIHSFVAKLLLRIERLGGHFIWENPVHTIERDARGEVTALKSKKGTLQADHYVLSLGATGNDLLTGTASENLMQGVLGVWLQIPNLHPQLQHSLKIHRRGHLVEDINVTVAKDTETGESILQFGGGYGYVGLDRPAQDSPELAALFAELEEVARIYFPRGHAAAKVRQSLFPGGENKFCVRPFTPNGLGVYESIATSSGGVLVITGGNNTGGFAQAPAFAQAVYRALIGEHDPVHALYHPRRGRLPGHKTAVKGDSSAEQSIPKAFTEPARRRDSARVGKPLKLLLLCSDGPQHRYLRCLYDKAFPGYKCIIEPGAGQLRQLQERGRTSEARWQKYHSFRRRLLGHDARRERYFEHLVPQDHKFSDPDLIVDSLNSKQVWALVEKWQPEVTIVSGTKYIGKKLNERAGLMINLHTGHLPEYKGNHCVFFALRDGAVDKVASTLHQLTPVLDGGKVLDVVYPDVLPSDDEEALYTKCVRLAIERSVEHVERFSRGEELNFAAQPVAGQVFRHRDRTPMRELALWWDIRISGLVRKVRHHSDFGSSGKVSEVSVVEKKAASSID